ncbi:MAG: hypothetical protein IJO42_03980 [Clostridia bacterium]|nr:hypothetical protein [Clostridia bacterium]
MKLFFKKLLIAPLYVGIGFAATFVFSLLLGPLNLPYLLQVPEETIYVLIIVLVLLFIAVVETIVRIDHCRQSFALEPDGRRLILRVLTFREYHMEILAVAVLSAAFGLCIGIGAASSVWVLVLGTVALTAVTAAGYAVADGLIWLIAAKRAHRK